MKAFCASFLILTEDSAERAVATISTVVRRILVYLEPATQTQRLELRPLDENDKGILAMHGNVWKSGKQHVQRQKVALVRAIASKLREDGGFAVFHFDADTAWANRDACANQRDFEMLRLNVEQLLRATLSHREHLPLTELEIGRSMRKLIPLVPFWCIESWLYQETSSGARHCHERGCGQHRQQFEAWEKDRGALDEVERPKELVCFRDTHNARLAQGFPVAFVYDAQKSFAKAVADFLACDDLLDALAQTWDGRGS